MSSKVLLEGASKSEIKITLGLYFGIWLLNSIYSVIILLRLLRQNEISSEIQYFEISDCESDDWDPCVIHMSEEAFQ